MSTRKIMLKHLDRCVNRHTGSRVRRLVRHPIETIRRSMWLRHRTADEARIKGVTARAFFDQPMQVTIPPAEELWLCGLYLDQSEINLTRHLILGLNQGEVVFDVGAHFGYYSLLAAKLVMPTGRVFAFDPSPAVLPSLRKNLAGISGVELIEKAVCNDAKQVEMLVGPGVFAGNSTINPADLREAGFDSLEKFNKVAVDAISLDQFCEDHGVVPNLIKIDVEGAEEQMLLGSRHTLENHSPVIAMEVWFETLTGNYTRSLRFLETLGYQPNAIGDDGILRPLKYADLTSYGREICARAEFKYGLDNLIFRKI